MQCRWVCQAPLLHHVTLSPDILLDCCPVIAGAERLVLARVVYAICNHHQW